MLTTSVAKVTRKPGNPKTKFVHVCAAAREMGIHRITLYRVLMGQFPDHQNYLMRYRAFVSAKEVGQ